MLSERDRQVLYQIEHGTSGTDPDFVTAMRAGRPRPPREYRRTWLVVLLVLGAVSFALVLITAHPLAVVAMLVVALTGLIRFVSRQLDGR